MPPHNIGYSTIHLGDNQYKIVYEARENRTYLEIKTLLNKYASELCAIDYTVENYDENRIDFMSWSGVIRPKNIKAVIAVLKCNEIDQKLFDKSHNNSIFLKLEQ